jgi:hypothetical protein
MKSAGGISLRCNKIEQWKIKIHLPTSIPSSIPETNSESNKEEFA